jgi:hypothetical protein
MLVVDFRPILMGTSNNRQLQFRTIIGTIHRLLRLTSGIRMPTGIIKTRTMMTGIISNRTMMTGIISNRTMMLENIKTMPIRFLDS